MPHPWIADRLAAFDSSGIRKVFELASKMTDPINLSIGQPDFDVPPQVKAAAIEAIESGKNGYSLTQGIAPLQEKLRRQITAEYGHEDRDVFVTSGTSGGLLLAILTLVNPGDEVIVFDPFFVMYPSLVELAGGTVVLVDTYPDFRINAENVRQRITPHTKAILLNSPCNPTGVVATEEEMRSLAQLAERNNIALVSDEIYRAFCYDAPFVSPARYNPFTLVIDGFSKSHAMTGWRLGFAHGPSEVIQQMVKLQQYTFVCAPQPAQWAGIKAMELHPQAHIDNYHKRRDRLVAGLAPEYELVCPGGAFYAFPKAPWGSGTEFVAAAIERQLLIIPGNVFSARDTHFRISYAADDATIDRGIEVLRELKQTGPR